jgi:hypothetical protein
MVRIVNLGIILGYEGCHAPNTYPKGGPAYKTNHNLDIQSQRRVTCIPCGPGGVVHDYVPFYFGYLSPMLLNLKTGRVPGYDEGQEPMIYLVSTAQEIQKSGARFVFSDGHGIAAYTKWYDDLSHLDKVDWDMVYQRYWAWAYNVNDMDCQRRKQAEFLVHGFCDWSLIHEIAVIDDRMKIKTESIMNRYSSKLQRPVRVRRSWYYN